MYKTYTGMWPSGEALGLPQCPSDPNAIIWSEDNLLAVLCGPAAMIIDPLDLQGEVFCSAFLQFLETFQDAIRLHT